jgi:hypothetical protein
MGIAYHTHIKILRITLHQHTRQIIADNWTRITRSIKTQASATYNTDLSLYQRMEYIHTYLLSKAWYAVQILPLPMQQERQISKIINWFTWHGAVFKVPQTTLQLAKNEGGWELINVAANSLMLYLLRSKELGQKNGTITGEWLKQWGQHKRSQNPPPPANDHKSTTELPMYN